MTGENSWTKIITALTDNSTEVVTVPSNKKEPLWFKSYIENGNVYVKNSETHSPPTKMSQPRKITVEDFLTVYAYYHRWANGERHLRQEVRMLSRNTAYIFALIAHFQ